MRNFATLPLLSVLFLWLCIVNVVKCNYWSNHGSCVGDSNLVNANKAIAQYYKDAEYTNWGRKTDFTYKYGSKTYRVWLDKNMAFPFGSDNANNWRTCNTGRSPCDGPVVSSGGECCYKVSAKFSGTECMRMDVCLI
ncbi:unnamed protein product [Mucor hiemalis]